MKIHCTRGCICDCLTVDGVGINDLSRGKKTHLLDKIEEYILERDIDDRVLDHIIAVAESCLYYRANTFPNHIITEDPDDEYCVLINGIKSNEMNQDCRKTFVRDVFDKLKTVLYDQADFTIWWFMTDYIGLDFQYYCEECGDCVYSGNIKL